MNELALFAGAGGGILGGQLLGWRTVCAVERDAYAAQILAQRQNDGSLEPFPIWADVRSFDGKPWRGIVDVVSGGFPCQDISAAGKGVGIEGERSGLWAEMARIIRDVRPRFVLVENSPMLTLRGLGRVLGDLASIGYDAQWQCLSAAEVGAPHLRDRIWIVANASRQRSGRRCQNAGWQTRGAFDRHDVETGYLSYAYGTWEQQPERFEQESRRRPGDVCQTTADTDRINDDDTGYGASEIPQLEATGIQNASSWAHPTISDPQHNRRPRRNTAGPGRKEKTDTTLSHSWWTAEPELGRVAYGVANRVDRIRAIGNGQVPLAAATAFRLLSNMYSKSAAGAEDTQ